MAEPKKYVGMRYVPKFSEPLEWNTNNKYEPLEMVLHEGNYYISRQFVPMDIDILNKEYWLPFALTLDGAAGLVSRVDSNTDAIIQNATALHEVENKATQNSLDIAGNTSSIASNTEDIATNFEMINKLIEHFTFEKTIDTYFSRLGGSGSSRIKISKDKKYLKIFIDGWSFQDNITEIEIAPKNSWIGGSDINIVGVPRCFTKNDYKGQEINARIVLKTDGSIVISSDGAFSQIQSDILYDLGLNLNTMTLPMTEDDYNQLESEVNNG